jgi:hypothetical protein
MDCEHEESSFSEIVCFKDLSQLGRSRSFVEVEFDLRLHGTQQLGG